MTELLTGLLLITGATGLLYQVVLGRLLALYVGSSGASHAITLAAFLGGLSLGALLVARVQRRRPNWLARPFRVYAALEAGIGVWMALFPHAADGVFSVYGSLAAGLSPTSWATSALKLGAAALLVLPLSTALGATLPVLASGVVGLTPSRASAIVSRFYAVNAAGAAIGAYIAGFWLIRAFGLELPLLLGALLNIGVGGVVFVAQRSLSALDVAAPRAALPVRGDGLPIRVAAIGAALTGVVSLLYEIVWTRLSGLVLGSNVTAFAMMLVVVIAGIAIGSAFASRAIARGASARAVFVVTQAFGGVAAAWLVTRLDALPVSSFELRALIAQRLDAYALWVHLGGAQVMVHFLPCAIALGASFPALLAATEASGVDPARATAWLLGANTLGNLIGALAGSFVLMPLIGLEWVLALGAMASVLIALVSAGRARGRLAVVAVAAAIVGLAFTRSWPEMSLLYRGLFRLDITTEHSPAEQLRARRHGPILMRRDGTDASIMVQTAGDIVSFRTNGKPDGSAGPSGTDDELTQVLLGHLGFAYAPAAKNVFIVGLGTGQTAMAAASHPGTEVTVAELNDGVVEAAPLFAPYTDNVLEKPNVHVEITDAREALRAAGPGSVDLYISEPSNPWVVGVGDLYTVEHLTRVRDRLSPHGALVQWIHAYELADALLRDIVCTARQVFPTLRVYRLSRGDFALVGAMADEPLDLSATRAWLATPSVAATFPPPGRPFPRTLEQLLVLNLSRGHTLASFCAAFDTPLEERFPRLEYDAPRFVFARHQATEVIRALDGRTKPPFDTELTALLRGAPKETIAGLREFLLADARDFETPLVLAATDRTQLPGAVTALIASRPAAPPGARGTPLSPTERRFCGELRGALEWAFVERETMFGPPLPELSDWLDRCTPQ